MSDLLPIFPLPNVVLFPSVFLPLHIFEPRYREMVADTLKDDRLIGMVLLRPGWQRDYDRRRPGAPGRGPGPRLAPRLSIPSTAAASSRTSTVSTTAATTSCCAESSGS